MKRILLCTDGSAFAQSSYPYAAWFAQGMGASVDVLYVTDSRGKATAEASNLSGSIGLGASESLLKKLVEVEHERAKLNHQRAKLILADAERTLNNQGVKTVNLIHKAGFLVDYLETLETNADLIVLGKRGEAADFASGHLGANVDRIVRSSSKPCLVTPREFAPLERLLMAYDGSPTGQRLLTFLANTPSLKPLDIHLLMAVKAELDPNAAQVLAEAVALLQQAGIKPKVSQPIGDPEKAIAQYIEAHSISLLLMGAYGHRRVRHLVIGSTALQLLRSSQIPVLLLR
ncbi:universal stress protein [Leptolyngbya sp. BC1307]|uniref:universal stress protein n=1 Tax=Leptolyngbya sp. BC1307 TaxID=2029589 RepID=UPI000EFBBF45|nr:universal stress protein [Leptolyngbya sp. BC1307]